MLLNKGIIFRHLKRLNEYDRVVCAGDDETDESMFREAGEADITIKVGEGDTHAKYTIGSPRALREILKSTISETE